MLDVILFTPFNVERNHILDDNSGGRATVGQLEILNHTHQQYY